MDASIIEEGKIVDIIKVMADTIASISEQTNLLALNAAIEAATAQKSSEHTETIVKSIDETTKAIDLVAETSQRQVAIAQKLNEMVERFKL